MTKMMKLCIGIAAFVAVTSAIRGDILAAAWAITAGLWMWLYAQADRRADAAIDLAWQYSVQADRSASIARRATAQLINHQCPPTGMRRIGSGSTPCDLTEARTLDDIIDDELHGDHYSVGGTRPHLCVCGTPLAEHQ